MIDYLILTRYSDNIKMMIDNYHPKMIVIITSKNELHNNIIEYCDAQNIPYLIFDSNTHSSYANITYLKFIAHVITDLEGSIIIEPDIIQAIQEHFFGKRIKNEHSCYQTRRS